MSATSVIPSELIEKKIFIVRGHKVMLDFHLAELYELETKVLVQAVRLNLDRFPDDFMFQLNKDEFQILRSQIVTSSWGGRRHYPFVFTEQGVAMLSNVLRSKRAVQVNIDIMRAFVKLRELLATNKELAKKLEEIERKYDAQFKIVFDILNQLMQPPEKTKRRIGFRVEEPKLKYAVRKK